MKKIKVELQKCYGIEKFSYEFDFSHSKVYSIYAPNGTMKTSFLKWFSDYKEWDNPSDVIYWLPWSIQIREDGWDFIHEIFPVESINHKYQANDAYSALLVNPSLRDEYQKLINELSSKKIKLISALNKMSGIKKDDLINKIKTDFWKLDIPEFVDFLINERELFSSTKGLENIKYSSIFDWSKVEKMINDPEFSDNRKEYETEFNTILKSQKYYSRWWFSPNVAFHLLKWLRDSRFMDEDGNAVILSWSEYENLSEFEKELMDSFKALQSNPKLRILREKMTEWTAAERTFAQLVNEHPNIVLEIKDKHFKKNLWVSYLYELQDEMDEYIDLHKKSLKDREDILQKAILEESQWHLVVKEFSERFQVPYKLWVEKSKDAILWISDIPILQYKYEIKWTDPKKYKSYNKRQLQDLDVLSWWEKRAMYLLDILFEMKMREKDWKEHLIIIDDITDSFDYANKYAIIEYLKELAKKPNFYFIILTHNFDFYRTVQWRLDIRSGKKRVTWDWANLASKDNCEWLKKYWNYIQPFNFFKWRIKTDKYTFIACIPLVRNLIEYWRGTDDESYSDLTKTLHKKDTKLTVTECSVIINSNLETDINYIDEISTYKYIIKACDEIVWLWTIELPLEQKICLTIWMRLLAETIMRDKHWWTEHEWNQIFKLYTETTDLLSDEEDKYISKIMIYTPESIHLNAFMFEPIVDMWSQKLIDIYTKIKNLV